MVVEVELDEEVLLKLVLLTEDEVELTELEVDDIELEVLDIELEEEVLLTEVLE